MTRAAVAVWVGMGFADNGSLRVGYELAVRWQDLCLRLKLREYLGH